MLPKKTQLDILKTTEDRWAERCEAGEMAGYMRRGERGHGLASFVEDVTVTMLSHRYPRKVAFQHTGTKRRKRSMGDVWIAHGGVYSPVNIKTGVVEPGKRSGGQPNLVSLAKLSEAIIHRWIDSYYLLLIRFTATDPPTAAVSLVDLLLIAEEFTHFDSGTGQLMLRASKFDNPPPPQYVVADPEVALAHLLAVREEGNRRLIANRRSALAKMKKEMARFDGQAPLDQSGLNLAPSR